MNFEEFLASSRSNEWIREPGLELYVRKNMIWKGLIDIANVRAKKPGQGCYTRFIERWDPELPLHFENTLNDRLIGWHRRLGHFEIPDMSFGLMPSFLNAVAVEQRLGPLKRIVPALRLTQRLSRGICSDEESPMKYPKGVRTCPRPKMTNHRGRTWDYCSVTLPDGSKARGHLDTTWGFNVYFEGPDGKWRSAPTTWDVGHGFNMHIDLREGQQPKDMF